MAFTCPVNAVHTNVDLRETDWVGGSVGEAVVELTCGHFATFKGGVLQNSITDASGAAITTANTSKLSGAKHSSAALRLFLQQERHR